jgi:ketosteroid isomerase-like protein
MKRFTTVFLISLGIVSGLTNVVQAQSAANAPAELTEAIAAIEAAANQKDINGVIEYYSPNFTNTDGLTPNSLTKALQQMWKNYPRLNYTTTIDSWSNQGDQLVAETTTSIKGVQNRQGRVIRLNSTIKSRQYFQQQKLVKQEILAEQSQLTSGENPPQVQIVAPETVTTGEKYNFDLIVDQPLGDKVLLGAVQEEKTASNLYLNPTALELEPLPAGGIYKTATAPMLPDSKWLSAILVRGDGMTMVTHRVNVTEKKANP